MSIKVNQEIKLIIHCIDETVIFKSHNYKNMDREKLAKWLSSLFQNSHWRLNLHNFTVSLELVTLAIVINIVIGGFSGEDLN